MQFKKLNFILILVILLLTPNFIFAKENILVIKKVLCSSNQIEIQFYNETNYYLMGENYSISEIEANSSLSFRSISGTLQIYDGPFDSGNMNLINTTISGNKYIYDITGDSHIQLLLINPTTNLTSFETVMNLNECDDTIGEVNTNLLPILEENNNNNITTILTENETQNIENTTNETSLIIENENSTIEEEINASTNGQETSIQDTVQNTNSDSPVETSQESTLSPILKGVKKLIPNPMIILYVVFGLAAIILILSFIFKKQKNKKIENSDNMGDEHKPQEVTNYKDTLSKTKHYIETYKDSYQREKIIESLTNAKIPKDIIDKAIKEVYN